MGGPEVVLLRTYFADCGLSWSPDGSISPSQIGITHKDPMQPFCCRGTRWSGAALPAHPRERLVEMPSRSSRMTVKESLSSEISTE